MLHVLTLYSTDGCHLCEMAFDLVGKIGLAEHTHIVDIAFDDVLFSRYGVTIPVLKYQDSELNWPFDLEPLKHWLDNNGITYYS